MNKKIINNSKGDTAIRAVIICFQMLTAHRRLYYVRPNQPLKRQSAVRRDRASETTDLSE
jgi:hypothetical protein